VELELVEVWLVEPCEVGLGDGALCEVPNAIAEP